MFHSLKNIIPKALSHRGLKPSFTAAYICKKAREALLNQFGASIEEKITTIYVKHNALFIEVASNVWAQELMLHKHTIHRHLRDEHQIEILEKVVIYTKYQ